ncbi:hypothetical protein [Bacillus sp. NPDC094106]|uniref:hypothetical protein n=1 Tax=Bacillus sp. NPDC094106 TaxID=3363949 RepID=UPI00382F0E6E
MDPGTWGWREWREPVRESAEEINSDNPSQINLKLEQKFAHPLYEYKMRISRIEAYKDESENGYTYGNASVFVKPYFQKDSNNIVELDEYEISPKEINDGKWFLINERER